MISDLTVSEMIADYGRSSNRLILLDYDGTLAPFDVYPGRIQVAEKTQTLIRDLTTDYKNTVFVISGRRQEELDMVWKDFPVSLVSEHGGFCKRPGGEWHCVFNKSADWMSLAYPSLKALEFQYNGSFVERKKYSLAWHYRAISDIITRDIKTQILNAVEELPGSEKFLIYDSEYAIELRTPGIDKGSFLLNWIGNRIFDFILAVGDEDTDEDLFKVLQGNYYTIRVGACEHSWANYRLARQEDVLSFLQFFRRENRIENSIS